MLAQAETLVRTAQDTLPVIGGALRTQVQLVSSAGQTLVNTLRASPPPTTSQVKSAAQGVLDALEGLSQLCTSPSPSAAVTSGE